MGFNRKWIKPSSPKSWFDFSKPKPEPEQEVEDEEPEDSFSVLDKLWEERTTGKFSDETLQELIRFDEGKIPVGLQAYIDKKKGGKK